MPCNFKKELIKAINSNPNLKAIHQKYLATTATIMLKLDNSKHKYNSNAYLNQYLAISKRLITKFTLAEKLLIVLLEADNSELVRILTDSADFEYILATMMDRKFFH